MRTDTSSLLPTLRSDSRTLYVLGNGKQRKSYLSYRICLAAMMLAIEKAQEKVQHLHLGTDEYASDDSISWICEYLGVTPQRAYMVGTWMGRDSPFIFLDCSRMRVLGWRPQLSIREGVLRTVLYLERILGCWNDADEHRGLLVCNLGTVYRGLRRVSRVFRSSALTRALRRSPVLKLVVFRFLSRACRSLYKREEKKDALSFAC